MTFAGMRAGPPNYRHLCHWEEVCRYLDSQPYRSIAYPFPSEPPISARLLKRMARFGLVRHRDTDCRWRLSPRWQAILVRLWQGAIDEAVEQEEAEPPAEEPDQPFVVDCGVDTLYAHLLSEQSLPAALGARCDALKARAQEEDTSVETPWVVLGAPLSMYKAGKGTDGSGRGVSWSYILRNARVMVVLRKRPLGELLGSVRLSAEALWTLEPRQALDTVRADLRRLWAVHGGRASWKTLRWQLSQIHLCADVAYFSPQPADLERVLTRSLKKAIHFPASEEVDLAFASAPEALFDGQEWGELLLTDEPWQVGMMPPEWEAMPLAAFEGVEESQQEEENWDAEENEDPPAPADEHGAAVYLWGQRASGFTFSPGAPLSAVWYDKILEERRSGKRWMETIHQSGGWEPEMPLTRVEVRFRRDVLRELKGAHLTASSSPGASPLPPSWFDDPWRAIEHLGELWAYFAGLPPEADRAPEVTYRGWMRLAQPTGDDSNRSRWPTDPVWETIQRAPFTATPPQALARRPKVSHDLAQVDAELYGLLKLRAVIRGEYLDTTTTLGLELRAFAARMEEVDAERGRDFAEEVREKARMLGKPVPRRPAGTLPVRRMRCPTSKRPLA
jgi:hypothetical protein